MKPLAIGTRILVMLVAAVGALILTLCQLALALPRPLLPGTFYSLQITEAFVNQYEANYHMLGQQLTSRLEPYVMVDTGIVGQSKSVERIGKSEAYDITARHSDTMYVNTPHSRRWLDLQDKGWADLIDELDQIRLLTDPTSAYTRTAVGAMNRAKDDVIYAAARGSARTASGTTALPTAQKIAEGGTGLTLAKLLTAKELLDTSETDDLGPDGQPGAGFVNRALVCSSKQLTNLYGTTEIKSVDYNNVKALSQGAIDTFLGFKFIRSERLAKSGTSRFAVAFTKGSVRLGIGKDVITSVDRLPTKNMSVQVYARQSLGAVRVEDEGVVEIACFE
jgi:hypothetical protein